MKTIREWFNELPDGYREVAIEAVQDVRGYGWAGPLQLDKPCSSMSNALCQFPWHIAKGGDIVWNMVHDYYISLEYKERWVIRNRTIIGGQAIAITQSSPTITITSTSSTPTRPQQ